MPTMKDARNYKCEKCNMEFNEEIRLVRHYKKAHPPKADDYKQKWYWDNPVFP